MVTTPITTATPAPEPTPPASISPFGRVVGVLFSPKPTYDDIVRKPSWLLPVLLLMVVGIVVAVGLNLRTNWRDVVTQQIEKNPRAAQLSPEQKEKQVEVGAKIAPYFVYVSTVIGPIIAALLVALIMLGAYNLLAGAGVNYRTSLAIVSHAYLPLILAHILFLVVLFLKPAGTMDLDNPVATNLAAFLPEGSPKWLDALGKNIDIFILWITMLIAIGFASASPRKLKGGNAFTIAFGMLVLWIVVRVGWAFIFS
jgi:Yip1 domain